MLVLRHMIRSRRRSVLWWSVGVALTALAIASAYPSVKESSAGLESYMESLPSGVVDLLGAGGGIATPAGYLNSQFYANVLPLLLVVLGIGVAAWTVAGAEGDGTLEMLLANPVRRGRVAGERLLGLLAITFVVALVATVVLAAVRSAFSLSSGLADGGLWAAGLGAWTLAVCFSAVTYAVGAATGRRGPAVAAGAAAAAATYVLYGLSGFVDALRPVRWVSPWYWFLDAAPLSAGFTSTYWLQAVLLPLAVAAVVCVLGIARFTRRDLA
jgi:ABC-2 type transport system permease protein